MFSGLESPMHWLVLAVIALIVLGPKRLPEAGRSLGAGLRGFRDAMAGGDDPAMRARNEDSGADSSDATPE